MAMLNNQRVPTFTPKMAQFCRQIFFSTMEHMGFCKNDGIAGTVIERCYNGIMMG